MTVAAEQTYRYDVFLSYSSVDRPAAETLEWQLRNFARPFYRTHTLKVFRDQASMAASGDLEQSLIQAMASARWLVVLASPEAAASRWVAFELQWWMANRGPDSILVGCTTAVPKWDKDRRSFNTEARPAVLPQVTDGMFRTQPRWVDLRWMRTPEAGGRADPRLASSAAEFVAAMRNLGKDDVHGEHIDRGRANRRWGLAGVAGLVAVIAVLALLLTFAVRQRDNATRESMAAQSRQLTAQAQTIADDQPELARQLLAQAWRLDRSGPVVGAVLQSPMMPRVLHPPGQADAVSFVRDGRALVVTDPRQVTFYDPASGVVIGQIGLTGSPALTSEVNADSSLLAVGHEDGTLELFDITDPRRPGPVGSLVTGLEFEGLSFSRDGDWIFGLGGGAAVVVVDVRTPATPTFVRTLEGVPTPPLWPDLDVSPDGDLLVTAGENGSVRMWSQPAGRGTPVARPDLPGYASAVAFSPAGLLAVGGEGDGLTRIWDVTKPDKPGLRATLSGLSVEELAFSSDGKVLAAGSSDGTVQLYDTTDPFRVTNGALLQAHGAAVDRLAFSHDGFTLATASLDGPGETATVRLWRLAGDQRSAAVAARLPTGDLSPPAWSPDGRELATPRAPATIWDLSIPSVPARRLTLPVLHLGGHAMVYGRDGRTVLVGSPPIAYDVSGPQPRRLTTAEPTEDGSAQSILFQPGRDVVATGDGVLVQLWDVSPEREPRLLDSLDQARGSPQGMAFRPDGVMLATLAAEDGVQLWDVSGVPARVVGVLPTGAVAESVAWSADGSTVYVGDGDGAISLWDTTAADRPQPKGSYVRHAGKVGGLVASPDGRLLASAANDGSVRLWDASVPGRLTETAILFDGGRTIDTALAFSPKGDLLAGPAQVWNVDDAAEIRVLCAQSARITPAQWAQYLPADDYDPPCR